MYTIENKKSFSQAVKYRMKKGAYYSNSEKKDIIS